MNDSFYYFEDPINATTSLLRPGFYGPTVRVALSGFHWTRKRSLKQKVWSEPGERRGCETLYATLNWFWEKNRLFSSLWIPKISAPLRKLLSSPYKVIVDHYHMNTTIVSILTWASLLQLVGLLVVEGVVETTVDLFVGGSLSSFSLVKIVLYNLSWNSFANIAACLSGLSFSSVFLSQSQVMFLLQVPVSKIQDITRT